MKTYKNLVLLAFILFCSCKSGNVSGQENSEQLPSVKPFTFPEIPVMLTDADQRAQFLTENFWQNFNFADTNYIHHPEITEQAWVDFINILPIVELPMAQKSLTKTFNQAEKEKKVYNYFAELAEKYLYEPNSPFRNEEYYISVLEHMIATPALEEVEKIRPISRLALALKNRVGTKALDFTYTLESGKEGRLSGIQSEYTLLFFNNPGCHACEEMISALKFSLPILKGVMEKSLTILAVYPDEELDEWKSHLKDFPKEWINGYDKSQEIQDKELYDLKAIPTIYLLDKEKKVILKDTSVEAVEAFFRKK